jgi:DNA-binding PadR family transcriptional regulator
MSKEQFVIDAILDMREYYWHFTLKRVDLKKYGISRGTAWRCLKELEKAGYIKKAVPYADRALGRKSWELTDAFKERFNQYKIKDAERFFSDLDSILVFNDEQFQQQIREKVHRLIKQHEGT